MIPSSMSDCWLACLPLSNPLLRGLVRGFLQRLFPPPPFLVVLIEPGFIQQKQSEECVRAEDCLGGSLLRS